MTRGRLEDLSLLPVALGTGVGRFASDKNSSAGVLKSEVAVCVCVGLTCVPSCLLTCRLPQRQVFLWTRDIGSAANI